MSGSLKSSDSVPPNGPLILRPSRGISGLRFDEIWRYRELLYFLTWRDIKVRYKQTLFGATWAVLQPFLLMVVFTIFFGRFARISSGDIPYPLFVYTGLVPWTFFSQSLGAASQSLVRNTELVSKIYFPRLLLPLSAAGSFVLDLAIASVLLVGLMLYYEYEPWLSIVWLPLFSLLALVTAVGLATWLSALNARYRDVQYAVPFLIQVWLFVSPVIYPSSLVPARWRLWYGLNPVVGVVDGFRWAFLGEPSLDLPVLAASASVSVLVLISGLFYFRSTERTFADVI